MLRRKLNTCCPNILPISVQRAILDCMLSHETIASVYLNHIELSAPPRHLDVLNYDQPTLLSVVMHLCDPRPRARVAILNVSCIEHARSLPISDWIMQRLGVHRTSGDGSDEFGALIASDALPVVIVITHFQRLIMPLQSARSFVAWARRVRQVSPKFTIVLCNNSASSYNHCRQWLDTARDE